MQAHKYCSVKGLQATTVLNTPAAAGHTLQGQQLPTAAGRDLEGHTIPVKSPGNAFQNHILVLIGNNLEHS